MLTLVATEAPSSGATEPGWIQPHALDELWFHTGTACNLDCPFCLEGSRPGDNRLQRITLADVRPLMDEALALEVRQFSFTGGEPFVVKDMVAILEHAASLRPCLVLTNGTAPVVRRLAQIRRLAGAAHPIAFRVSLDFPDEGRHDAGRGAGNFRLALQGLRGLHKAGFRVSVARQVQAGRDEREIDSEFGQLLAAEGLPADLQILSLPDFGLPGEQLTVPRITTDCMTRHHTDATRRAFMCASSKMAVKQGGRMRIYACALVDDDPRYDQGDSLAGALGSRVLLQHHRCYSCFSCGSSSSRLGW
ncbi:MAG: radical SAM protein [Gammaproteobacteria bacterium]